MTFPVITLSYLIPISLIHSFLSIRVVFARTRLRVPFGDGGQDEFARRIRAHGNLIEYLPLAIILMGSLEILGERPMVMHAAMALLLAARGRPLKILVPMVTETFEFRQTKQVLCKEMDRLRRAGQAVPEKVEIGAMVEVPSLLFELDQIMPESDFVSIGSNDLVQFLTAADRANPRVSKAYDPIALPRLRAIRLVVDAAARHNKPVTMCGELAGKPMEALALMAIGMTRLSMGPASIGPIKEMILNLELEPVKAAISEALSVGANGNSVRNLLTEWAEKQNLPMG
mgnify:CR=1 FL=1